MDQVASNTVELEEEEAVTVSSEKEIVERIKHILSIYPKLSWSQLQVSIGTANPPKSWKPVAEKMIAEGIMLRSTIYKPAPTGRVQSYTILELADKSE